MKTVYQNEPILSTLPTPSFLFAVFIPPLSPFTLLPATPPSRLSCSVVSSCQTHYLAETPAPSILPPTHFLEEHVRPEPLLFCILFLNHEYMAPQVSSRPQRGGGCSSGHGWGFIAADVEDPPRCIATCRERFLRELLPKDETFERACEALANRGQQQQHFRALYCCDSQLCGVDNLGERGRDRMCDAGKV